MAYEKPDFFHTFAASTGLRQYQAVALNTSGVLINPTTEGNCIGILVSSGTDGSTGRAGSANSGSVQTVQMSGISKVVAGTTGIAIGGLLKADIDGRASTAAIGSTSYKFGMALDAVGSTSTSAQVISVWLTPSAHNFA